MSDLKLVNVSYAGWRLNRSVTTLRTWWRQGYLVEPFMYRDSERGPLQWIKYEIDDVEALILNNPGLLTRGADKKPMRELAEKHYATRGYANVYV